ncbi:MAG: hypothetical protein ACU83N_11880 [Gammaproteobacteria bacterium]
MNSKLGQISIAVVFKFVRVGYGGVGENMKKNVFFCFLAAAIGGIINQWTDLCVDRK